MTNREIDARIESDVFHFHEPMCSLWVRKFSTDPAASKQLRDKMRADGWRYVIQALGSSDRFVARFWRVRVSDEDDPRTVLESDAYADTEEMAVALAALKALGQGGRLADAAGKSK